MARRGLLSLVFALCAWTLFAGSASAQGVALPAVGPACDEATLGPEEKVLVFSKTTGFRHPSIEPGRDAICAFAGADGIAVDWTEDAAGFTTATLEQYDAVVFLSTTGDPLDAAQQTAFEEYIQGGGGFAGIHAASDTEYDWPWYGELVGAYFESHPANQDATVKVSDAEHPSTAGLPQRWERHDEWYNFRSNPRGDVHVLATLDESSYTGGADGADHPTAWCHNYDGGRSWYTGGGHTNESYAEPQFRQHLLGGIKWAAGLADGECSGTRWDSFERVTLAKTAAETGEPIGLAVLPNRGVLHTSRDGVVRYTNAAGDTKVAARIPVYSHDEDGLQTITIDPDFATNNWVYVYYAPPLDTPGGDAPGTGTAAQFEAFEGVNHLSRFKWDPVAEELVLGSEQKLLEVDQDRGICCHNGGDFAWDADGNLYLSTGDDTNPFESDGYTPIDERSNRNPAFDGQRTSANTNDLRGKVLRIKPDPAAASYTIPSGNLFPAGEMGTRPEIFAMGFRNPFRISVDQETGYVYVGDYGPDSGAPSPTRGPGGQVEFSVLRAAGNYGWPYCTGDNDAYNDYDFATGQSGAPFNCAAPVNSSPRNTGKTSLPPALLPDIWYGNGGPWEAEMAPGGSESPMAGPVYHYDPDNPSETKFPAYYDDHWFPYEWGRDWIKETALDANRGPLEVSAFLDDPAFRWQNPMDMEFGPDGALYVLDYGGGFFGGDAESALYRVDYVQGGRRPIAEAAADRTSTSESTLTVQFSSDGSRDPDGDPITYEWDFADGSPTTSEPNPTHTYTAAGTYRATLTVTDETGRTGTADVSISVGNAAPEIAVTSPAEGGFFDFGDQIPYDVTVTDAEDGTVSGTSPDCARVEIDYLLGHDEHAHPLTDATGCRGDIQTAADGGHGDDSNVFGVLAAGYTDKGGRPGTSPLTSTAEIVLWPKLLQAEHYTEMRGIQTVAQANAGGGERVGYTDDAGGAEGVNYIAWDPVNLANIDSLTVTASSGGGGGPIEVRLDDPEDGPLLGTVNVPNTGAWENQREFELPITAPAGTHKLLLTFPRGGLDVDQIRFNGKGIASNAKPRATASATPVKGGVPLPVEFTGEATDPDGDTLTYEWDFGDGSAKATTQNASHTYDEPGTYTATFTARDAGGLTASDSVTVEATDCPAEPPEPSDEFDSAELDTCRWTEIVRDNPAGRSMVGGKLSIDTQNGTDMYGGNTNAQNIVLQPAPEGGWEATTKVDITLAEKTYEQAALMVYGDDDNFVKLSFIKVPNGRQLEYMLQDEGQPVDGGAVDRSPLLDANFANTIHLRVKSDGQFLTAAYSANGTDWIPVGRARSLSAIPDPRIGVAAFNGDGDGDKAAFDSFRVTDGGTGEPTCTTSAQPDPGYRMLFDNTQASLAKWKMAGPGGFNFTPDCTIESFGGLGLYYYEEEFDRPYTVKMEWMMPGDDNSGVFIGFGDPGTDPWYAVNNGHEVQIDATDDPDSTTGAIYNAQAANIARRDEALNPPGQWNTYEITLDSPKIYVRLNGYLINEYTASSTEAAQRLARGFMGLQNHGTGDEVYFRDIQVKEHGPMRQIPCDGASTTGSDDFEGDAFDGCRWSETVRYDPGTLEQSGGKLHVETSGGDIYGANDTEPSNIVLQDAPAGDWSMETEVHVPLVKCCQQAGLIVHGSDDDYVKFDVIADEGRGEARIELRSETGDVVAEPQASEWVPYPESDTYWLRLTKTGDAYAGAYKVTEDGEWTEFGTTVSNTAVAGAPVGVFALGIFQDAPIYASFESLTITGDGGPGEPGETPTVQGFADPTSGSAPLAVRFSATGVDPQNSPLTYSWDFGDGKRSFERSPQHTYTEPGTYTATVSAADRDGNVGTDEVEITVSGNQSPAVEASSDVESGSAPLRVRLSATGSDPDGPARALEYEWDFGDGGTAYGRNAAHTYREPGTYVAQVTVTDAQGATGTDEVQITATNEAPEVEATADPGTGSSPLRVRFTSRGTDVDGGPLQYAWDFGDGGTADTRNALHTYAGEGSYTATVTVTDRHGATGTADVAIEVSNGAPTVRAAADPRSGTAPLRVRFSSTGSDPDGDRLSYVWDFGTGVRAGGPTATYTYTQPGTYQATVTVTDAGGKSGTATVPVTVSAPGAAAQGLAAPLPSVGDVAGESDSRAVLGRAIELRRTGRRLKVRVAVPEAGRLVLSPRVARGERTVRQKARRVKVRSARMLTVTLRLTRAVRRAAARGRLAVRVTYVASSGDRSVRTVRLKARR
jgi:cytochrome c